jgi:hypothetical protein
MPSIAIIMPTNAWILVRWSKQARAQRSAKYLLSRFRDLLPCYYNAAINQSEHPDSAFRPTTIPSNDGKLARGSKQLLSQRQAKSLFRSHNRLYMPNILPGLILAEHPSFVVHRLGP